MFAVSPRSPPPLPAAATQQGLGKLEGFSVAVVLAVVAASWGGGSCLSPRWGCELTAVGLDIPW